MAAAAIIASSVVLLAFAILRHGLGVVVATPTWTILPAFVLIGAICARHARSRWLAFFGLRHVSTYPPLWLPGVSGAVGVIFVLATAPVVLETVGLPAEYAVPLAHVGFVGAAAVGGVLLLSICQVAWRANRRRITLKKNAETDRAHDKSTAEKSLHGSFERLTSWLADDAAVTSDEHDAFGHSRIARRIASRLKHEHPPAQAVVGRLGAGKTTLRKLVVDALEMKPRAPHVHVIAVELWPYETPRAAVEGVIGALVDALSHEVNVPALRGISESYVQAMSSVGGLWSAIAHLQGTPKNPFDALKKIDEVATSIGQRYVVWVEDLERFAGRGTGIEHETLEDAERLNPIRALLYGLDQLESVTVITATTSLHVRFDLEKIARFVEEIPELPEHEVARVISTFRNGCRERFDVIDPGDPSVRKELEKLGDHERLEIRRAILSTRIHSLQDALPALCTTPRTLKHALRSALDTWKRLAGEIDVDDLLAMSILREAEPEVFALVRQHVDAFRKRSSLQDEKRDALQAWETAFGKMALDNRTRLAINEVIKFVFTHQSPEMKPQGFLNTRPRDYWQRFLAVPELTGAERDQEVLRVVIADDDNALLGLIEDGRCSDAVESFSRMISTDRLRRLLVPLIGRRAAEAASVWPAGDPPGMIPLWRMWLRRAERGQLKPAQVLEEVCRAFDAAVPSSLHLAERIEHYFVVSGGDVHDMLKDNDVSLTQQAKNHFRDLVLRTYAGKPEALANALVAADLPTLLWVCWGLDRVRASDMTGEPFPCWSKIASTILDAARLRPAEVIPQLACLVIRESTVLAQGGNFAQRYEFDESAATNLFGTVDTVLDIFQSQDESQWAGSGPVGAVFAAVKERRKPDAT